MYLSFLVTTTLLFFPALLPFISYNYVRIYGLFTFALFYLIFLTFYVFSNELNFWYQLLLEHSHLSYYNFAYTLGIDSISLCFLLLCSFILLVCFLAYWNLKYQIHFYYGLLLFSLWILINVFTVIDLFYFYVFFEAILIPMFFLITLWGSRSRKIYAAYQLFIYTLLGSILMLFAFFTIYFNKGSSCFDFVLYAPFFERRQMLLWILLFLGFSVKIPVVPFHLWLPEAHVEAPTTGSVILAGILLKLGTYAMLRFLFGAFSPVLTNLMFFVLIIAFWGFMHSSLVAFTQIDIKKIIAYSSIAHMNFSLLGLFSLHILGLTGAFVMMFGHALTASALFLGIGVLYDRYKTRLIFYYSTMVIFMPLFALFYFFFILSNFGFPGTVNFVGEFMITIGAFYATNLLTFFTTLGLVLTLIYSLFFYNRVFFGPIQITFIRYYSDYTRLEFFIHLIFLALIVYWGLYPSILWTFPYAKLFHINYFFI